MPAQPAIASIQQNGEDSDSGLSSLTDSESEYELERSPTPPPPKKKAAPRKSSGQVGVKGAAGRTAKAGPKSVQARAAAAAAAANVASTSTAPAPVKEEDEEEPPAETLPKVSPKTKRTRASTTQATASSRAKSTKNEKKIIPMFDRKRRTENMSVADIYRLVTKGIINLNAEYQREVVWTVDKQSSLIDSIMQNIHIPPLIFSMENNSDIMTCMDGKQRITSIKRFMDGEIPLKDSRSGKRYWFCGNPKTKTSTRQQIDEDSRDRFTRTQIVLVYYDNITIEQEREIFGRVQNGVALTPAERMRAINSPPAGVVRAAEAHIRDVLNHPPIIAFMQADGERFYTIAQLAMLVCNAKADAPDTTRTERWLNGTSVARVPHFWRAFNMLLIIAMEETGDTEGWTSASDWTPPSGAEIVMAGYLAYHWREREVAHVIAGVRALWAQVREAHAGPKGKVKLTEAVYKKMKDFAKASPRSTASGWTWGGLGQNAGPRASEKVTAAVPELAMGLEELRAFVAGLGGAAQVTTAAVASAPAPAPIPQAISKRKEAPTTEGERSTKRAPVADPLPTVLNPLGRKRKNEEDESARPAKKRAGEAGAGSVAASISSSSTTLKATASCQQAVQSAGQAGAGSSGSSTKRAAPSTQQTSPKKVSTFAPLSKTVAAKNGKSKAATTIKPRKSSANTPVVGQGTGQANAMSTNQASSTSIGASGSTTSSAQGNAASSPYDNTPIPMASLPHFQRFSASAPIDNVLSPSLARMARKSSMDSTASASAPASAPSTSASHSSSSTRPAESSLPTPPSTTSSLPPASASLPPKPDLSGQLPRPPALPQRSGRGGRGRLMENLQTQFGAPSPTGTNPSLLGWGAPAGGARSPLNASSPVLGPGSSAWGDRRTTDPRIRGSASNSPIIPPPPGQR
ncbi:hypothetical protein EV714DRAFT_276261 [Schizophyllum commune]